MRVCQERGPDTHLYSIFRQPYFGTFCWVRAISTYLTYSAKTSLLCELCATIACQWPFKRFLGHAKNSQDT
eukprot:3041838-Amphidinium_carterae.1